jgi:hypothetical protein
MDVMRSARVAIVLSCLLFLQGCAAAVLSIAGFAGEFGLDHTLNGIVTKTYVAPMAGTRIATLHTLERMGMAVTKNEKKDGDWVIEASTEGRKIEIELEPLSGRATRLEVVVSQAHFELLKDSSTGNKIVDQVAVELARIPAERQRLATAQMLLDDLGYDPGEADGLMGRKTQNAIYLFQRKNRLRVDGKVTANLIKTLEELDAVRKAAALEARKAKAAKSTRGSAHPIH